MTKRHKICCVSVSSHHARTDKEAKLMFKKLHDHLFGGIEKIDIHCHSLHAPQSVRARVEDYCKLINHKIPITISPDARDVDFALVHYSNGLLRSAHADVVVIAS